MKRRQRDRWFVNFALLVGIVILLIALLLGGPEAPQGRRILGGILPDEITHVRITRPGKQTIELIRQSTFWEMQSPIQARADDAVLQRVLSIAELEIVSQINPDDVQLEDFGLQPAKMNLVINDTIIHFGDLQPVNKLRYLLIDNTIYLVADQHMSQLNAGSVSYIDRRLVPEGSTVREILIDGNSIELTDSIQTQWQFIKANWVSHADKAGETGLIIQIRVQNQDAVIEYLASKRETDLVLTRNDLQYHLPHNVIDTLGLPFEYPSIE